jgi:cytochrome c biogenesis protein CcmG/thiol:disulfide interchange protein DsbE
LISKPVPEFKLPPVKGRQLGLASADFRKDKVSIMNVFASWCTACLDEHPLLMRLAATNTIDIYGLNYKDKPDAAAGWLDKYGDPYTRTGADIKGSIGIDWGVYGVPETFIVDRQGIIAYKHIGPIKQSDLDGTILPLIKKLQNTKTIPIKNEIK